MYISKGDSPSSRAQRDVSHGEVVEFYAERRLGEVGHEFQAEHVEGLLPLLLRERHIPRRQHHRDDGRAVGEGVVVVSDVVALFPQGVELREHPVRALPRSLAHEDEVGVLRPDAALFHDADHLVEGEFDMRLGEQRIAESDLAARAGMHGEDAVILRDELCERDEFVALCVDAGLVHEAEGAAERAAAHRLVHEFHLRLYLRGSERTGGVAGNAYPGRPLSHERHEIEHEPPFRAPFEFGKGTRLHRAEKPAAHLVAVRRGLRDPERRKAAIACYLSGDALPEEGGVKHLRVIAVVKKVVVGMSVYEPRRDDEPGAVDHGVRLS